MIRCNVELEARMIDDLLDLTRIGRDEIRLRFEVVDSHAALSASLEACRSQVAEKKLDVGLALRAERHHIWADPMRLQQVFRNLLDNAAKFTPEGGRVSLRSASDESGRLTITIEDDGIGIDPEALKKIFDTFEQAGRTVTRGQGGLGLGLSIAKDLVEKHGGALIAASAGRGKGASFTLELPTIHADAEPEPPPPALEEPARMISILLVEDHEDTLRVIARLLKGLGYSVTTARGVGEALDLSDRGRFDFLVSDIGLPDGSGLDIMRKFRENQGVRGIALSGFELDADVARSREAGFDEHLIKPVDFELLRSRIAAIAP